MQTSLRRSLCALATAAVLAGGAARAQADPTPDPTSTYYVNSGGQDVPSCGTSAYFTCATIQYAIDERATDGDTVSVAAGSYPGTVSLDKAVDLVGAGDPVIDGSGADLSTAGPAPIVTIDSTSGSASITGFTITGGVTPSSAATQIGILAAGATGTSTIGDNTISAVTDGIEVDAAASSATAAVTGNSVTLTSGGNGGVDGAGIVLNADSGGVLHVTLGGNTGRVTAPTASVVETGAGAVDVTPTDTPNAILPAGGPTTFTFGPPDVLVPNAAPVAGIASTVSVPTATLPHARVDVSMTGPNTIDPADVYLYDGPSRRIELSSTESGSLDGMLDPAGGSPLAPGAGRDYHLTIDLHDVPYGALTFTFSLVEVSPADGAVLNTIAVTSHTSTVRDNHSPTPTTKAVTVAFDAHAAQITLTGTDPDGDQLAYDVDSATHGAVAQATPHSPAITFRPTTGYVGPASITYTVSDPYGLSAQGTLSITVAAAATTMSVAISPTTPNAAQVPTAKVTLSSAGSVNGGTVTIALGTIKRTAKVANGTASLLLVHYTGGSHTVVASFAATATAQAASARSTFTVTKVTPTLSFSTNPSQLTTKTRTGRATVKVTAPGLSVAGVRVTIKEGSRTIGTATTTSAGVATIALPALAIGQHNWTIGYPGSTTTNAVSRSVAVRVALG